MDTQYILVCLYIASYTNCLFKKFRLSSFYLYLIIFSLTSLNSFSQRTFLSFILYLSSLICIIYFICLIPFSLSISLSLPLFISLFLSSFISLNLRFYSNFTSKDQNQLQFILFILLYLFTPSILFFSFLSFIRLISSFFLLTYCSLLLVSF